MDLEEIANLATYMDADIAPKRNSVLTGCSDYAMDYQQISLMSASQQFLWGGFGGCLIVCFKIWLYAQRLPPETAWPRFTFKLCLLGGFWTIFPCISGLLSIVCDPHYPLIAVFDGASAPALFILLTMQFDAHSNGNHG